MNPVEILIEEHKNILRGLKLLIKTSEYFEKGEKLDDSINQLILFFRQYADIGHHQKEEDLLFTALYEKNPELQNEFSPLYELNLQHIEGRRIVVELEKKTNQFPFYVQDYNSLLTRHIEIEDNLFPELVDTHFDEAEIVNLQSKFLSVEDVDNSRDLLKILEKVSFTL